MNDRIPQSIDLLISGGCVLTCAGGQGLHFPGSVAVADGVILAVGPSAELDSSFDPKITIRAEKHVLLPGLINIHGHASNSLIRGLGNDLPLHDWLEKICWPCMNIADDEDLYNGVLLSCAEMLLNGVTTFADMWKGVGSSARAVKASGLRALLAHNLKDFGNIQDGERELQVAWDAWQRWDRAADGRIRVGLGPHSVYTCTPETLQACALLARRQGLHIQIHASETQREVEECLERHGRTPIEHIDKLGLLGRNCVVAHAVHVRQNDIALLKSSGASVAHNIVSNLKLASGIAPVHRYLREGIPVGIGTDGPGSNDGLDVLRDLKTAALVQKTLAGNPARFAASQTLEMATMGGARALGWSDEIGSLEVGKKADIILLDFDQPHLAPCFFDWRENVLAYLIYVASGRDVDTVIVDGRVLVQDRRPVELELEEVITRAQRSAARIVQKFELK